MTAHSVENETSRAVIDRPYSEIRRFEWFCSSLLDRVTAAGIVELLRIALCLLARSHTRVSDLSRRN